MIRFRNKWFNLIIPNRIYVLENYSMKTVTLFVYAKLLSRNKKKKESKAHSQNYIVNKDFYKRCSDFKIYDNP